MGIAERLGWLIHWLGFLGGFFIFIISLILGWEDILVRFVGGIIFTICWGIGWFIRWILVGKVKFLPWQQNPKD